MKPRNFVLPLFGVLLLGACGLLWRGYLKALEREEFAAVNRVRRAAGATPKSQLPPSVAPVSPVRAQAGPPPIRPPPNPGGGKPVTPDMVKEWYKVVNDPLIMSRLTADARALTVTRYADFFAQLHLTAEQAEAFSKMLDDKRVAAMDLAVASIQNGLDPRDDLNAFQARVDAARQAIEEEIRAFLGDDRYTQYEAYNRSMGVTAAFTRIERVVGGTENALNPDQAANLKQLLLGSPNGLVTPELISKAQGFLSPPQLEALQKAYAAQGKIARGRMLEALPPTAGK